MSTWTPERIEKLKGLWNAGRSASQCAEALGITRNAAIAKIHRLREAGEPMRQAPVRERKSMALFPRTRVEERGRVVLPPPPAKPVLKLAGNGHVFEEAAAPPPKVEIDRDQAFSPLPGTEPVPFMELRRSMCRWPVGGDGALMVCCGAATPDASEPYCGPHLTLSRNGKPVSAKELIRSVRRHAA